MRRHASITETFFCRALAVLALVALIGGIAVAADWPRWRGEDGDGFYGGDDFEVEAIRAGLTAAWTTNVGAGYSAVAVVSDRLYTMGNTDRTDYVGCIDVNTGQTIWTFSYPCQPSQYPGPRATPFVHDGRVYTFSSEGHIFCLDAQTGEKIWGINISESMQARAPRWGFSGSAIVEGQKVIVNAGRHGMAFDKDTGETIWASPPQAPGYATPVVYELDGERAVAVFGAEAIYGVSLKDGSELWSYPWETSHDVNAADPLFFDQYCFITSGYRRGAALLDISSEEVTKVWETSALSAQFSSCTILDGHIYGITGNAGRGELVCIDATTGERKWSHNTGFGGHIAVADKLIIGNERGTVYVARANNESYVELAQSDTFSPGRARIWTAPVIANGRLYIRSSTGDLACYDVSGRHVASQD